MSKYRYSLREKYMTQRLNASRRNIDWQFTYEEWLDWWGDDIINRGRGKHKLCMARIGDTGPYNPDNVYKTTLENNVKDMDQTIKTSIVKTPLGIFNSVKEAAMAHNCHRDTIHRRLNSLDQYEYIFQRYGAK